MILTPQLIDLGRRNFLRAMAGVPPFIAFGAAAAWRGPIRGGPVRAALIGPGSQGKVLLGQCQKEFIDLQAICDINPGHRTQAVDSLVSRGWAKPREYEDWKDMLAKEPDIEAVIVATPLWTHAEITVGCLDAGKHVLCEKMMAHDIDGARRMLQAAQRNGRLLEVGHNRFYSPAYNAAYEHVIKPGLIGDIYHVRLAYHRNQTWRRDTKPPSPDYNPSRWGYPTWEHLVNWRMYRRYSQGLTAELGSHQVSTTNWYFDATPTAVVGSGGIHRYKDGREVNDHVYAIFEYPGGRTAVFSSIQSNKLEHFYEQFMGTKGTLIIRGETDALLFSEDDQRATGVEVSTRTSDAVADASESRTADAAGRTAQQSAPGQSGSGDRLVMYKLEVAGFCSSIRAGTPLKCTPEQGLITTKACLAANQAIDTKQRVEIGPETT